jgi:hypothetical protein
MRTIGTKGRTNIWVAVLGPHQIIIRHLIFSGDLRWFKIFVWCDIWSVRVNSSSCEKVFGLVNCCCMRTLGHFDVFLEIVPKW